MEGSLGYVFVMGMLVPLLIDMSGGDQYSGGLLLNNCCALCAIYAASSVFEKLAKKSSPLLGAKEAAAIVKKATGIYIDLCPDGTYLEIQQAVAFTGASVTAAPDDGFPAFGVPPTSTSAAGLADPLKLQSQLLPFTLVAAEHIVARATMARQVIDFAVYVDGHFVSMVVDGLQGPGRCVVQIQETNGSGLPYLTRRHQPFRGNCVIFTLCECPEDFPSAPRVSKAVQAALDAVHNPSGARGTPLTPGMSVPMHYQLYHLIAKGLLTNKRCKADAILESSSSRGVWGLYQIYPKIQFTQLLPVAEPKPEPAEEAADEDVVEILCPGTPFANGCSTPCRRSTDSSRSISMGGDNPHVQQQLQQLEAAMRKRSYRSSIEDGCLSPPLVPSSRRTTPFGSTATSPMPSQGGAPPAPAAASPTLTLPPASSGSIPFLLKPLRPILTRISSQTSSSPEEPGTPSPKAAVPRLRRTYSSLAAPRVPVTVEEGSEEPGNATADATVAAGAGGGVGSLKAAAAATRSVWGRAGHKVAKRARSAGQAVAAAFKGCFAPSF